MSSYTDYFVLKSSLGNSKVYFSFFKIEDIPGFELTKSILHRDEECYFKTLKYEKRINSYLMGRYCAKLAVSELLDEKDLTKILIKNGIFGQPICYCEQNSNIQVSISHGENFGAAVAFSETLSLGIDIEIIDPKKERVLEEQLTQWERDLALTVPHKYDYFLTMMWTVKESLSKVLKTGLTIPAHIMEINKVEIKNGYSVSHFSNFIQYRTISFAIKDNVCSITYPKNAEIMIDIDKIKENLN